NFGPDPESHATVDHVAGEIANAFDGSIERGASDPAMKEAVVLRLDNTKAKAQLGWRPIWPLENALEQTAAWYKAARTNSNMANVTAAQIDQYLKQLS
ncbi:MAG: hypothetical protein KDE14_12410, partial [Rhodobacteraceae bacterium]|nr:hypothetical protein [Paracoccaceae bacterium]